MKVLIINLDKAIFEEGSTSRKRLVDYSGFLDKLFVIVFTCEKKEPMIYDNKLFIYPTNSRNRFFYYINSLRIAARILKYEKIDLIFTQDPFETGFAGYLLKKIYHVPLQIQIHTDFLSPFFSQESFLNKARVLLAGFLLKRADCVRAVSKRIKNSLIASFKIPAEKIKVLPIFVDVKKIKETQVKIDLKQKYLEFNFITLIASRLSKEKNIALAISAMKDVVKNYSKAGLIIAGNGPEKNNLKSLIKKFNLEKNIIMESAVSFDTLVSYYKTADLFLLTSNYEGYGMVVAEAMAAGCPVLMTDVGLANEILINKKDGMVVPPQNKEKLQDAILNLIQNPDIRKTFSKNSLTVVDFLPTKEEYLKSYYRMLKNCVC